jgi:hypothetical protein
MNACNYGPSRFYRVNHTKAVLPVSTLRDWRDVLCATPETTATCATNTRNCN